MGFGPVDRRKHLVVAEVAAAVAQILARGGNRVGAVLFDSEVERVVPPGHGRTQVLRILEHLLREPAKRAAAAAQTGRRRSRAAPQPAVRATDLSVPLRAALGLVRRRSLVVLVSDFIGEPGWERPLGMLARRHDVVAIQVVDRREFELPAAGTVWVEDAETGEQILVDTDDDAFQSRLRALAQERQDTLAAGARSAGTDLHVVATDEDLVRALARIADLRRRRAAR